MSRRGKINERRKKENILFRSEVKTKEAQMSTLQGQLEKSNKQLDQTKLIVKKLEAEKEYQVDTSTWDCLK